MADRDWTDVGKSLLDTGLRTVGGMFGGSAGEKVAGLVSGVLGLSEDASPAEVNAALQNATPEQVIELKRLDNRLEEKRLDVAVSHHEIDAATIGSVNTTMQAESGTGHPWQGAWRPVWGFVSAAAFFVAVIGIFVIVYVAIKNGNKDLITQVPALISALAMLFSIPGAILGVASWHRGQKQRIEAGETKKGLIDSIGGLIKK